MICLTFGAYWPIFPYLPMNSLCNFPAFLLSFIFILIRSTICRQINATSGVDFGNVETRGEDFIWRIQKT